MKEKDYIKNLFKDRFDSFEAPVDASLWSGIESNIGSSGSSSWIKGVSNGVVSSAAVVAVIAISVGAYINYNVQEPLVEEIPTEEVSTVVEKEDNFKGAENEVALPVAKEVDQDNEKSLVNTNDSELKNSTKVNDGIEKNGNTSILDSDNGNDQLAEEKFEAKEPADLELENSVNPNIVSNAPSEIVVEDQSKVLASPSGGVAPLNVSFSAISDVVEVKWKFDDGQESSEIHPNHEFQNPGIYFVTMLAKLSDGSVVMDKAIVEVKEPAKDKETVVEESSIFVPNIFTPNGDGENDVLQVSTKGIYSYTISIYSVNGKLVYQNDNPETFWDGRDLSGNRVEDGTYYYLINALGKDEKVYTPKGYLTIRGAN